MQGEIGRGGLEQRPGGRRDRPLVEQPVRFLFGHCVSEAEAKLFLRQGNRLVQIRRVAQTGQTGTQLRQGQRKDALDLGRVDRDAGGTVTLTEELLGEQTAEGVPDDHRRDR